jgi:hypothetical protein
VHNKKISVVAVCVNDPERSRVAIHRRNTAPTPTGFAEIVGDDGFCPSIVRFRRRIETKFFCTWDIGQPLLMEPGRSWDKSKFLKPLVALSNSSVAIAPLRRR